MSFIIKRTVLAGRPRAIAFAPRAFSTSFVVRKSATETVKETLETVNKKVGETLAGGIDAAENATKQAASAAGMSADEAKGKAEELTGASKGKADEVLGAAKGKAYEAAGAVKGKVNETQGKL